MAKWTAFHKQLRNIFTELVDQPSIIRQVVQDSGLKAYSINFNNASESVWQYVIEEAVVQENLPELFQEMRLRFPRNAKLADVYNQFASEQFLRNNSYWSQRCFKDIRDDELEKLMGPVPTFLPVAYLYAGWIASKSVVRIRSPEGCGTGFFISKRLLMTNNHVLFSPNIARESYIDCDYQVGIDGSYITPISYSLDADLFHTDEKLDITILGVKLPKEVEILPLRFSDQKVLNNDRVSIIQHPEG